MSVRSGAARAARATSSEGYPRGLIPPSRRGRSQRLIGDVVVDLGFADREAVDRAVATARAGRAG
jgi:hypothetical protein